MTSIVSVDGVIERVRVAAAAAAAAEGYPKERAYASSLSRMRDTRKSVIRADLIEWPNSSRGGTCFARPDFRTLCRADVCVATPPRLS